MFQTRLGRHIERKHAEKVSHFKDFSPEEKKRELRRIRNEGIYKYNVDCEKEGKPLMRARKSVKDNGRLVYCSECKAFLSKKNFYLHNCNKFASKSEAKPNPDILCQISDLEFRSTILPIMRDDEIGRIVRKCSYILRIGVKVFHSISSAKRKLLTVKTSGTMRRLAIIYRSFVNNFTSEKTPSFTEMFSLRHYETVHSTIQQMLNAIKSSAMSLNYGYTMISAIKYLLLIYDDDGDDIQAEALKKFNKKFRRDWNVLFRPTSRFSK